MYGEFSFYREKEAPFGEIALEALQGPRRGVFVFNGAGKEAGPLRGSQEVPFSRMHPEEVPTPGLLRLTESAEAQTGNLPLLLLTPPPPMFMYGFCSVSLSLSLSISQFLVGYLSSTTSSIRQEKGTQRLTFWVWRLPGEWWSSAMKGWGSKSVCSLPRKFVFLRFRGRELGMQREFGRDVLTFSLLISGFS